MNVKLRKTEAGLQALQSREAGVRLPARLRTLLLQVDGRKRTAELARLAVSLGSTADVVETLMEMGLVEVVPGSQIKSPPPPAATQRVGAASKTMPANTDAGYAEQTTEEDEQEPLVSTKLPELFQPIALMMHEVTDTHLGTRAAILKRRISKSETEAELRLSLMALREALAKSNGYLHADKALQYVYPTLPLFSFKAAPAF
ncbi:hypothetical protein [Chitinimonas sp. BJB300]|uniref:hypothetical protein n=1 Tax=Chitinimonas sp. BJB300 TaxID=1559339 RepID=UPI000C103CA7|nr:hypothetical protein [Chitinimonas sp. BJB300]PHV13306.1 hypothetical protein CSQ89_01310 [Chitinimonas sp. BJB300]TSJ85989.1 hypothetical protein FG002_016610 [Chitinimonas sp. BJB300]